MSVSLASLGPGAALHVATLAGIAAWVFLYLWLAAGNAPNKAVQGPVTSDLAVEPPSVAGLLAGSFVVPRSAMPATVLDLAARGFIEISLVAGGHHVIGLKAKDPTGLNAYERQVMDHIAKLTVGGVVPASALASGTKSASMLWWGRFRKHVIADAQARGLTVDRWSGGHLGTLAGGLVALAPTTAIALRSREIGVGRSPLALLVVVAFGLTVLFYTKMMATHAQRDTRRGLLAAGRWLGIRAALAKNEGLAVLPPSSVVLWERHFAYAAALGLAQAACAGLPLGPEDDRVAWSSEGGRWRRVDVRYLWRPWWGMHPLLAFPLAAMGVFVAGVFVRWSGPATLRILTGAPGNYGGLRPAVATFGVLFAVALVTACLALLAVIEALVARPVTVTGVIVRARARTRIVHPDNNAKRFFIAVDDGTQDRIVAVCVDGRTYARVSQGDRVRVTYRRGLGVVTDLGPAELPSAIAS